MPNSNGETVGQQIRREAREIYENSGRNPRYKPTENGRSPNCVEDTPIRS
jgi:hypothetical protein